MRTCGECEAERGAVSGKTHPMVEWGQETHSSLFVCLGFFFDLISAPNPNQVFFFLFGSNLSNQCNKNTDLQTEY